MSAPVLVGMADIKVAKSTGTLTCVGLGSCIGVCAFDSSQGIAGLAHIMLPEAFDKGHVDKLGKFADTGVPELLRQMAELGANTRRLQIAIVGGAQVFKFGTPGTAPKMDIGARNIEAVQKALKEAGLSIQSKDVGGNLGRTVTLEVNTGTVKVRTVSKAEVVLCSFKGAMPLAA